MVAEGAVPCSLCAPVTVQGWCATSDLTCLPGSGILTSSVFLVTVGDFTGSGADFICWGMLGWCVCHHLCSQRYFFP